MTRAIDKIDIKLRKIILDQQGADWANCQYDGSNRAINAVIGSAKEPLSYKDIESLLEGETYFNQKTKRRQPVINITNHLKWLQGFRDGDKNGNKTGPALVNKTDASLYILSEIGYQIIQNTYGQILRQSDLVIADSAQYVPNKIDQRPRALREIAIRPGQTAFREALRIRYGDVCQVTRCQIIEVLEAAHISPYLGEKDDDPENGLLLRADIHTLFDLGKMAINPETLEVRFHPFVSGEYSEYVGKVLVCQYNKYPSRSSLMDRYSCFQRTLTNENDCD